MGNIYLLKKLYLFKDLSDTELELINGATEIVNYGQGDEVFSQGDAADALFIIQSGMIKIHQTAESDLQVEVARIGPGSHFGEMSFLDGESRSASAVALEASQLIVVNYERLNKIMTTHQAVAVLFYSQFARFLCGRLRVTTQDLSFSRSQILTHF